MKSTKPLNNGHWKNAKEAEKFLKKYFLRAIHALHLPSEFQQVKREDRGRTAADKKTEISHEKARTHIDVFGLKSIYNSIQLICQFPP